MKILVRNENGKKSFNFNIENFIKIEDLNIGEDLTIRLNFDSKYKDLIVDKTKEFNIVRRGLFWEELESMCIDLLFTKVSSNKFLSHMFREDNKIYSNTISNDVYPNATIQAHSFFDYFLLKIWVENFSLEENLSFFKKPERGLI